MFFLARKTQFGSCAPKATQIQKLYFPAFAIPSSFPFLPEGFVLLYKETWFNFNCETQKPLSEINTFFFFFSQKRYDFKNYQMRGLFLPKIWYKIKNMMDLFRNMLYWGFQQDLAQIISTSLKILTLILKLFCFLSPFSLLIFLFWHFNKKWNVILLLA